MRKFTCVLLVSFSLVSPFNQAHAISWRILDCLRFIAALAAGIAPTAEMNAVIGFILEKAQWIIDQEAMAKDLEQEFKTKDAVFQDKDTGVYPYVRPERPDKKRSDRFLFADVNTLSYDRKNKTLSPNYATAKMYDYAAADHIGKNAEKELLHIQGLDTDTYDQRDHRYVTARETVLRSYVETAALRARMKNEIEPTFEQVKAVLHTFNVDVNTNVIASTTVSEASADVAAIAVRANGMAGKVIAMSKIYDTSKRISDENKEPLPSALTTTDF